MIVPGRSGELKWCCCCCWGWLTTADTLSPRSNTSIKLASASSSVGLGGPARSTSDVRIINNTPAKKTKAACAVKESEIFGKFGQFSRNLKFSLKGRREKKRTIA